MTIFKTWIVAWSLATLMASLAYGQAITGTISGVVRDPSGGLLPGTAITITSVGTGLATSAVTDSEGHYRVQQLSSGDYQVQAQLSGFGTAVRSGIALTIGREALVNFTLELGDLAETTTVVGDAPGVNLTSGTVSGLVDERTIRELPLNSRDLMQLANLQPAVSIVRQSSPDRDGGFGMQISIAGARSSQNTYLLDGQTLNDQTNQAPASISGSVMGVDSIREFVVLTSSYSAEYGRNSGGVVSAVTRSGSNQYSGSAFHFLRNDRLDRRNFFDQDEKPAFTRNQFGATVGGPLVRGRTFFFGSFEGMRQSLGQTRVSVVPTAPARQGQLPGGSVPVNPVMLPYLDLYPLPTGGGRDFGDGTAEHINVVTTTAEENYGMWRVDQTWTPGHSLYGRYSVSMAEQVEPHPLGFQTGTFKTRKHFVAAEQRDAIGRGVLNSLRVAYNTSPWNHMVTQAQSLDPSLLFVPNQPLLGGMSVPGMSGLTIGNTGAMWYKLFEVMNNVTYVRGAHSLTAGGHLQRIHDDQDRRFNSEGSYNFSSLANFLQGTPSTFGSVVPPTDAVRHIRQTYVGTYLQDRWQLTPNLTVDLGLRYEMVTVPTETAGKSSNVLDLENDTVVTIGPVWKNPTRLNFAPRLAAAWNVTGDGRTVLRAGFGKFFDEPMAIAYRLPLSRLPPYFIQATASGSVPFPDGLSVLQASPLVTLDTIDYDIKTPYLHQFNVSADREISPGGVVTVAFIGSRGHNLPVMFSEWNQAVPEVLPDGRLYWDAGLPRRNPAFGNIRLRQTIGSSSYDSVFVGFAQRQTSSFQFRTSYTWSRMHDQGTNITITGEPESPLYEVWNLHDARGLSSLDLRHNFMLSAVVLLPFGEHAAGIRKALISGWQVNSILRLMGGQPFSVNVGFDRARFRARSSGDGQRPDLAAGASDNPVLGGPVQYFDPLAFDLPEAGFLGTLGRNTLIGPGLATVDLSMVKNHRLGGTRSLQVRLEAFNLLDRANLGRPAATLFSTSGRVGSAGQIRSTATSARQLQIGLRFAF